MDETDGQGLHVLDARLLQIEQIDIVSEGAIVKTKGCDEVKCRDGWYGLTLVSGENIV